MGYVIQVKNFISNESPNIIALLISTFSTTLDNFNPINNDGTAIINPAIGPAAPICSKASFLYMGDFILVKTPNVPIRNKNGGAGKK